LLAVFVAFIAVAGCCDIELLWCRVNSWPRHLSTESSVRLCRRWRWSFLTLWKDQ